MAKPKVAMQMYTLRGQADQDYAGTVKQLAKIGYRAIQVSGFGNATPKEIRKVMDDLQMGSAGTHLGLEMMEDEFEEVVEITKTLRAGYAIIPHVGEERRRSADDWRRLAEIFTDIGRRLKAEGLGLAYHNHSFEFQKFDGKYGYDILFENVDRDVVQTEIDTYWVQHGGADPVAYLKRHAKHIQIVHFKDMGPGPKKPMVPVGTGILDWPAILKACEAGGAQWACIEQDDCAPLEPLEAARVSLENCKKWGLE
ncbi:MAG: sugar phosphate isomerase/epimerase [Phycisphaerae bacterium]